MSVNPRTINLIVFARLLVIWLLMPHAFCCVRLIFIQMDDIEDPWKNLRRNLDPNVPQVRAHSCRCPYPCGSARCRRPSSLRR